MQESIVHKLSSSQLVLVPHLQTQSNSFWHTASKPAGQLADVTTPYSHRQLCPVEKEENTNSYNVTITNKITNNFMFLTSDLKTI
jgi:hypothetical protein